MTGPREAASSGAGAPFDPRESFDATAIGGEIQRRIGVKTVRGEPLAKHTTMRVGGPAELFVVAHNVFELRALGRPAAASVVADLLLDLAERRPLPDPAAVERRSRGLQA